MTNKYQEFLQLHYSNEPLLIGNVWNVQSAKVFEQLNFKAVATSSAAVAETLGYADGQKMSIEEYMFVIRRIASSISIPLSVDLEAGYGNTPEEVCAVIAQLHAIGVAGINIEDSIVKDGTRHLVSAEVFTEKLRQICRILKAENISLFINIRSDCFLLGLPNALDEALVRTALYQDTSVQGLFFPCITQIEDIAKVTKASRLPVNVMCMPGLPGFKQLQEASVKRISMGNFLNKHIYQTLKIAAEKILSERNFDSAFNFS